MPEVDKSSLVLLARATAPRHGLDPDVVCGMVERESNWNPWTIRYEPGFLAKYVSPFLVAGKISPTEAYARSFSWGLMQVMGETARENGFTGSFFTELCDPQAGLDIGCKVFAARMARSSSAGVALLAWNGGANPNYPQEVFAFAAKFRAQFPKAT